jgi:hypothetical protein
MNFFNTTLNLIDRVDYGYKEILESIKEGALMVNERLRVKVTDI